MTGTESVDLPGFLFDMNRFFERLVEQFLRDHLPGSTVLGQKRLQDLFSYDVAYNPKRRCAPTPRPDFVVVTEGRAPAVLDAKYRDLWERALPSDMLYQLAAYTRSEVAGGSAAIIYPTTDPRALEQRIILRDPLKGNHQATIALRPLPLQVLADLLAVPGSPARVKARSTLARRIAYGSDEASRYPEPAGAVQTEC